MINNTDMLTGRDSVSVPADAVTPVRLVPPG